MRRRKQRGVMSTHGHFVVNYVVYRCRLQIVVDGTDSKLGGNNYGRQRGKISSHSSTLTRQNKCR